MMAAAMIQLQQPCLLAKSSIRYAFDNGTHSGVFYSIVTHPAIGLLLEGHTVPAERLHRVLWWHEWGYTSGSERCKPKNHAPWHPCHRLPPLLVAWYLPQHHIQRFLWHGAASSGWLHHLCLQWLQ
jgi:hypothetical protein